MFTHYHIPMYYIFGYGSLINLQSASQTLGRTIGPESIAVATLSDYVRAWRVVIPVIAGLDASKPVNAVFLDIEKQSGKRVNGILIQVTLAELKRLDLRELGYDRVDVTQSITPKFPHAVVFTYQGKPDCLTTTASAAKVLGDYVEIVNKGVLRLGEAFRKEFENTTKPHNFDVLIGKYKFLDGQQNILTGR